MIERIKSGVSRFQADVLPERASQFSDLAAGQSPMALMVTCSDSRIDPNLVTQTEPGELFVIRNAGNMIPPYPPAGGGEGGTVEFAVTGLKVPHIIVCGHSHCGAMKAALAPESAAPMPSLRTWLELTRETAAKVQDTHADATDGDKLRTITEANVLAQLASLETYPCVKDAVAKGDLQLHGWVYHFETGEILAHNPETGRFVPLHGEN